MKTMLIALATFLFALGSARGAETDQEALNSLGKQIAAAFNNRDKAAVADLFDARLFGERAAVSMTDDPREREAVVNAMIKMAPDRLFKAMVDQMAMAKSRLRYLRSMRVDNEDRLLIRADMGGGYDYMEFVVVRRNGTDRKIADWYQLTIGQLMSDVVGSASRLVTDPNSSLISRMLGLKEVDSSVAETFRAVGALNRDGKFAEALAAMQKLPPPVLANRLVGRLQILLATKADDQKAYRELLARFSSNLKDNPSDAFLLIDHYYFQNDYAAALRSIDIVERHVGRDGVMQLLRSSTLFLKGDYRECLAKASDAIRIEPDLQEPYTIAAKCHTGLKEFREAIAMLQSLEQKFNLRISREALAQDPHFADLVNSSEFKGHFGTGEKL